MNRNLWREIESTHEFEVVEDFNILKRIRQALM